MRHTDTEHREQQSHGYTRISTVSAETLDQQNEALTAANVAKTFSASCRVRAMTVQVWQS